MWNDLRPYSHSSLYYSHLSLRGWCVYLSRCVYVSFVTEWMDDSIRHSALSHTQHSTHTRATIALTRQKCRFSHSCHTTLNDSRPCATNFTAFVCFKCQVENEKRLQANCDCSAFFSTFWQSHFISDSHTIFCAWINLLHAGEQFFHGIWERNNCLIQTKLNWNAYTSFGQCDSQKIAYFGADE